MKSNATKQRFVNNFLFVSCLCGNTVTKSYLSTFNEHCFVIVSHSSFVFFFEKNQFPSLYSSDCVYFAKMLPSAIYFPFWAVILDTNFREEEVKWLSLFSFCVNDNANNSRARQ